MYKKVLPVSYLYLYFIITSLPFISMGDFGGLILGTIFIWSTGNPGLYKRNCRLINMFMAIFVLCIIQGFVYLISGNMYFRYFSRGVSTSLNAIVLIFFSFRLCEMYGKKVYDNAVSGYMLSHLFLIFTAIPLFGISAVFNSVFGLFTRGITAVDDNECGAYLEQSHAFLLIAPFLFLVYVYHFLKKRNKHDLLFSLILLFMVLASYKRIAIAAAIVTSLTFVIKRFFNKGLIIIAGIICMFGLIFYVYIIHEGIIYAFANLYDINLMFRDKIWPEFYDYYSIDLSFWGQGWDFASKFLHENNVKLTGVEIGGLHNDILKIYIDLGLVGSIFFWLFLIVYIPIKLLQKKEVEASFFWWASQYYMLFIYLTDNAMIYACCQILIYVLTISRLKKFQEQKMI